MESLLMHICVTRPQWVNSHEFLNMPKVVKDPGVILLSGQFNMSHLAGCEAHEMILCSPARARGHSVALALTLSTTPSLTYTQWWISISAKQLYNIRTFEIVLSNWTIQIIWFWTNFNVPASLLDPLGHSGGVVHWVGPTAKAEH